MIGYIVLLAKDHDGFCLWDTTSTMCKVTRSPLGRDVLAELHQSCDQYGIKLAICYGEGEFADNKGYRPRGYQSDMKETQLRELLTRFGPIEYLWIDNSQGDGGMSHALLPPVLADQWVDRGRPTLPAHVQIPRKLRIRRIPVSWLFSGWNWQAKRLPRSTAAAKVWVP